MASRRTKRADGRYLVTLTVENPDGSTRRVYFYGRTQAEARAKAREAQERIALGAPVRDASRSFGDWLSEWRATFLAASDRAPSTKALYGGLLERHARPQLDQVPLARITPADLTRVLLAMEKVGRAASTRRNLGCTPGDPLGRKTSERGPSASPVVAGSPLDSDPTGG
jgi:hypothetical protein